MAGSEDRAVLVLSGTTDRTADAVVAALARQSASVARLDPGDFPTLLKMSARCVAGQWAARIWSCDIDVDLSRIDAIYYHRPNRFRMPNGMSAGDAIFAAVEARLGFGGVLAALDTLWVNDPRCVAVAEYKPLQLRRAERAGLRIPRTLVTNDNREAAAFAADLDGPMVCKTLSSLVLSTGGEPYITYTTMVDAADLDETQVGATAHLFQEWIPKSHDVRVTMVGDNPIAVAIFAGSDRARVDWRSDYAHLRYELVEAPAVTTAAMVNYLRSFDLNYGAFDFVVTPDGEWIMLECNPAGQWLWLEEEASTPISDAFAELLMRPRHG